MFHEERLESSSRSFVFDRSAGVELIAEGWENKGFSGDFAYQWNIPNRERVNRSDLRSGEYSNSSVEAGVHWFGLVAGLRF